MKNTADWRHRTLCSLLCLAGLLPAPLWGGETAPGAQAALVPASWETQSVHELLRRDLDEALRVSADKLASSSEHAPVAAVRAPQLVALYGVGQALRAEVRIGSRTYLYRRGQTWPAGYREDPEIYSLRAMTDACVRLARGDEQHSLCLHALLGDQP